VSAALRKLRGAACLSESRNSSHAGRDGAPGCAWAIALLPRRWPHCRRSRRSCAANCRHAALVCCWQLSAEALWLLESMQTLLPGRAAATVHTAAESIGARLQRVCGGAVEPSPL
jgi:hypothetical protein